MRASSTRHGRAALAAAFALAVLVLGASAPGCGGSVGTGDPRSGPAAPRAVHDRAEGVRAAESGSRSLERVREAVLTGVARDFANGTGIGGPRFADCVRDLLGEALDRRTLTRVLRIRHRPEGQQRAARALNELAAPLAARCGHRSYVPELVEASRGLPIERLAGARKRAEVRRLPAGWTEIARPITGVVYPAQVLAASTFPIALRRRPRACGPPRGVLRQMPVDGALLQIVEYVPRNELGERVRVPELPPRPRRFSYADATWAPFECAGPSYRFAYRQAGRALQAQVWMHRGAVDPRLRAGALRILDRFRPGGD